MWQWSCISRARVHMMHDESIDPLKEFRRVNVDGTEALARAAVEQGVRRMVFVSTVKVNGESTSGSAVYGGDQPIPRIPTLFRSARPKKLCAPLGPKTGLEIVIVRPPLVYGPGVRANFLRLIKLVERGIPLPLPDTKTSGA